MEAKNIDEMSIDELQSNVIRRNLIMLKRGLHKKQENKHT